jgi:uncharacterized membrane protein YkvA (DUF1232 family)
MPWWGWLLLGLGIAALAIVLIVFILRRWIQRLRHDPLLRRIEALPLRAKLALASRLLRDRRVPRLAKVLLPALILYLAMPLDIIPDFIPVVGYLDDAAVVLLVAVVFFRKLPRQVLEEIVGELEASTKRREGRGP